MVLLPDLFCCDGDWNEVEERLYAKFREDLVDDTPVLDGLPVRLKYVEGDPGKREAFWHLITEGNDGDPEEARIVDFRRAERIAWIRVLIDNADDAELRRWEQNKNGKITYCIAPDDFSYLVCLAKRTANDYYLLLTAFPVQSQKKREKHRKEYEQFKAGKGP